MQIALLTGVPKTDGDSERDAIEGAPQPTRAWQN